MERLFPIFCTHETAKPPATRKRDRKGRLLLASTCTPESVATVPWCKDSKGRPREHASEQTRTA